MSGRRRAPLPARPLLLVVDVEEARRDTLSRSLSAAGFVVETASNVRTALALVLHAQPAAVVLGALPPGTSPLSACRQVRAAALTDRPLPILLLHADVAGSTALADVHVVPTPHADRLVAVLRTVVALPLADVPDPDHAWITRALSAAPPATTVQSDRQLDVAAETLLDAAVDGLLVVTDRGQVQWANAEALRLLGGTRAHTEGRLLTALVLDEGTPIVTRDSASTGAWYSTVVRTIDGGITAVDLCVRRLASEPPRYLVTLRDASPRQTAEDIDRTNSDLREQLHRSQRIGALGRLAGGLAHDFNNVLQVISGYAEALASDQVEPATRRRVVGLVQTAADRASSITRQLLAFGRRQVLVPQVVDLNAHVTHLEEMLRRLIGEDVQLVSALAPDAQLVKVDVGQMEQVLLNLALNARDAMPQGGTLEITTANLSLATEWAPPTLPAPIPRGEWVLVTVRDTGIGMDPDTVGQAFEPFFTTKDPTLGSGLGLSMVYGIVKQSGGFTWIDSAPGAGTSVHVVLPACEARSDGAVAPAPAAPSPGTGRHTGTILLVEDEPQVRALFAAFLRHAGHEVIEATDGRDALAQFDARSGRVDVVVTDVVMPHVSGPALAAALRARRPDVRVLFVSGYNEPVGADGDTGWTSRLAKPVTRLALLDEIARLLARAAPDSD